MNILLLIWKQNILPLFHTLDGKIRRFTWKGTIFDFWFLDCECKRSLVPLVFIWCGRFDYFLTRKKTTLIVIWWLRFNQIINQFVAYRYNMSCFINWQIMKNLLISWFAKPFNSSTMMLVYMVIDLENIEWPNIIGKQFCCQMHKTNHMNWLHWSQ